MKFESIRGNIQRFLDLMRARGGPQGMIEHGIAWDKVAWGRSLQDEYFKITQEKDEKKRVHFYSHKSGVLQEWTKEELAYSCDLYDKDGKLLSIMFLGF